MATTLNRLREVRFSTAETGVNMPGGLGGMKHYALGSGWKRASEPFTVQFPYTGTVFSGSCIRAANPAISTYHPTPLDGSVPFFGLNDQKWNKTNAVLMNRAWDKFVEKARVTNLDYGASLAEGRETFRMIANTLMKLRRSYKALKRGNFSQFLKELGLKPLHKHRSKVRQAADKASETWLEYWFGWSPLLGDISSGLDFLVSDTIWPSGRFHGSAGGRVSGYVPALGYGQIKSLRFEGSAFAKQGATVKVENYNLLLLNQLGFVNPASVAWELVPFSFVVDWFTNVGQVISGYTDLVGLSISDPYSVKYLRGTVTGEYENRLFNQPRNPSICVWRTGRVVRTTSLTQPVLVTPDILNFGNSITRAASAASLLVQMFLTGK